MDKIYEIASLVVGMKQPLDGLGFITQCLAEESPAEGATKEEVQLKGLCLARRMDYFTGCLWCILHELERVKYEIDKLTGEA